VGDVGGRGVYCDARGSSSIAPGSAGDVFLKAPVSRRNSARARRPFFGSEDVGEGDLLVWFVEVSSGGLVTGAFAYDVIAGLASSSAWA